jgi:hypothetical protein
VDVARAYASAVRGAPAREVVRRQLRTALARLAEGAGDPSLGYTASLGLGSAGAGLVLMRAGRPARARRIFERATRCRDGFAAAPGSGLPAWPACSLLHGRAGALLGAALVGAGPEAYLALAQHARAASAELYAGAAGYLAGLAALLRRGRDPRVLAAGATVAETLLAGAGRGPVLWEELGWGVAHGAAGVHLAVLAWHRAARRPPPPRFARSLRALLPEAARAVDAHPWRTTFCNGLAGIAFLAARAGRAAEAVRAATACLGAPGPPGLCCGAVGLAYSGLALARFDPVWRSVAWSLALGLPAAQLREDLARLAGSDAARDLTLLRGDAGRACLLADLLAGDENPRFPGLEL